MKVCTKCRVEKPLDAFHKWHGYKDGIRPDCKVCRSEYGRRRQQEKSRDLAVRKYGISADQYDDVLGIQNGKCAICGGLPESRALAVDHDHETGMNRGILCARCNGGLGMFKDDPALMWRAADYIMFWREGWAMALD